MALRFLIYILLFAVPVLSIVKIAQAQSTVSTSPAPFNVDQYRKEALSHPYIAWAKQNGKTVVWHLNYNFSPGKHSTYAEKLIEGNPNNTKVDIVNVDIMGTLPADGSFYGVNASTYVVTNQPREKYLFEKNTTEAMCSAQMPAQIKTNFNFEEALAGLKKISPQPTQKVSKPAAVQPSQAPKPKPKVALKPLPNPPVSQTKLQQIYDQAQPEAMPMINASYIACDHLFENPTLELSQIAKLAKYLNLHPHVNITLVGFASGTFKGMKTADFLKVTLTNDEGCIHSKYKGKKVLDLINGRNAYIEDALMRFGVSQARIKKVPGGWGGWNNGRRVEVHYQN